jgi:hypothetical protein
MTASTTEAKPAARQSRAARGAQAAKASAHGKPANTPKATAPKATPKAKSTPQPKAAPEPKGPSATEQKQQTAQWAVDLIAAALAKNPPAGVERDQAAGWLNAWCSYFPGARQGRVTWPAIFGQVSMAGAAKKS